MQLLFKTKPAYTEVEPHKLLINVGSLIDIPTGKYVRGQRGENILIGGLATLTAVAGRGNTFKSTIAHYMILSAASKMADSGIAPYINTYDTEINIDRDRLLSFAHSFSNFNGINLYKEGIWSITDKVQHMGNEWYKILRDFLKNEKVKNKKTYTLETPMVDEEKKPIHAMYPTFGEIDSISEFETADIGEIQNKNELGDSGGNTIHMRSGLAKTRLLMELPAICNSAAHYTVMTAHVGQETAIQTGPMSLPPPKKLQHMRQGEKIKGVTDKFFFLPTAVWQTMSTTNLTNQTTKGPEYPKLRTDEDTHSTDLNLVSIKMLRNKMGPSGFTLDLIVSQTEGVLPTLTEFHFLKEKGKRYGMEGNNVTYNMILYPDVKVGRTTIREKIDTDPLLRRAIKITADLLQIKTFYKNYPYEIPDVKELYEKLGKKYDWKVLLNTRDHWTFNNYKTEVPFLSTADLIEMYYDKYHPFWLSK